MDHCDNSGTGILVALILFFVFVWFLQLIWNCALVPVVTILCEINYWQALLLVLSLWLVSWLIAAPFAAATYAGGKTYGEKLMKKYAVDME